MAQFIYRQEIRPPFPQFLEDEAAQGTGQIGIQGDGDGEFLPPFKEVCEQCLNGIVHQFFVMRDPYPVPE